MDAAIIILIVCNGGLAIFNKNIHSFLGWLMAGVGWMGYIFKVGC